jgi:hypothetical protein
MNALTIGADEQQSTLRACGDHDQRRTGQIKPVAFSRLKGRGLVTPGGKSLRGRITACRPAESPSALR